MQGTLGLSRPPAGFLLDLWGALTLRKSGLTQSNTKTNPNLGSKASLNFLASLLPPVSPYA
jgi:hypothetical protein